MIEKLLNKNVHTAKEMQSVFQDSYKVEAALLKASNFPPLSRALVDYIEADSEFFGYRKNETLAGVVEIIHYTSYIHIRSLVVHPTFFRQGIARQLMQFVLDNHTTTLFVVETGVDNGPATNLYKKLGFIETKQWETDHGIRKVKFELPRIN